MENQIKATGFSSTGDNIEETYSYVSLRTFASITLSSFAIKQLLCGALVDKSGSTSTHEGIELAIKLGVYATDLPDEKATIPVERDGVKMMKDWCTARLNHCEEERKLELEDSKRPKVFNQDTYITQKLLLLDLREWLAVDVTPEAIASKSRKY